MHSQGIAVWIVLGMGLLWGSCAKQNTAWPPPPRNAQERVVLEAALRAVSQIDQWEQTACVVERSKDQWRVQAWRIVYPEAQGRARCVPWAVRGITLDASGKVLEYRNHL